MKNTFNTDCFRDNPKEFVKLWVKVGIKHPVTYIDAFARITIGLWYPDMNYKDEKAYHPYWEWKSTGQDDPDRFKGYVLIERKPIGIFKWLENINDDLSYENSYQAIPVISLLFSSGIVIWGILYYSLMVVYYKKYKYLVVSAVPFILWLTLILGPVVLYRYIYPMAVTIPVFFASCHVVCNKSDRVELKN